MARLILLLPAVCFFFFASAQTINPDSCRHIVETLAADSFMGRFTASEKGEAAGKYIANEFSKAGCVPLGANQSFFVPFTLRWGGEARDANNIVAVIPGKSKAHEWIIFSAHYDHIGTTAENPIRFMPEKGNPEKGDTIYNGANDNASGTTALILLARYFGQAKNNERSIVFMAFSGEELGLFGSRHISYHMQNHDSVIAMINMDMLGVPISRRNKTPFMTGSELSDLRDILNKTLNERAPETYGKSFFTRDRFPGERLFTRSDNFWFAKKGVPAHTIIATHPRDQFYHSLNDEPGTLDYELLAKIIRALAIGTGSIIDGTRTPSRINPFNIKE
jgi:Zn-dependent M28 family amino/carboxypeptidase